jgi:hypothetical protein
VAHKDRIKGGKADKKSPKDFDKDAIAEGTKVEIKSSLDSWIEIEVGNGNVGWIERIKVEKI